MRAIFGFSSPMLAPLIPLVLFTSLFLENTNAERIFTIKNHCPTPVKLIINGRSHGILSSKKTVTKSFAETWSGFIYTSANGGNAKGTGSTRAGFYGESDYYYIVRDPKKFNVGMSVIPKVKRTDGFCAADICDTRDCKTAFNSPPTRFPGPETSAPSSPLFSCPGKKVGYTVIFCPSEYFPPPKGSVSIHPDGNPDKCLDVRRSVFENGTPVQIFDCNNTPAQRWFVKHGSTSQIRVAGTHFCLDAGNVHKSETPVKIWKCQEHNRNQEWRHDTVEKKLWLAGTDFALDLRDGNLTNTNPVQISFGHHHDTDQVWTIEKF